MPTLIHTVSDYFFKYRKDLFFVKFKQKKNPDRSLDIFSVDGDPEGRTELLDWIKDNLRNTKCIPLAPYTVDSEIIDAPYDGTIALLWDDQDRKIYEEHWEEPDGTSKDKRFQLYQYPLSTYTRNYDGKIPDPNDLMDF